MVHFPVLQRLEVDQYQLYPGSGNYRLDISFGRSPTIIAGVNGLGKSTLINVLLRLLTGPFDLPLPAQDGDLGEVEPEPAPTDLSKFFSNRVADGAKNATAVLHLAVGTSRFKITRRLDDLTLIAFSIDGDGVENTSLERIYQKRLTELMELGSFFDVLLVLRYVIFLLEDRRALVWGTTSQRELLRALFIPPRTATRLSSLRYTMLSRDSAYRNMRNVLNRRIKENENEIAKISVVSGARAALRVLQADLDAVRKSEEELQERISVAESERESARLSAVNASLERDSLVRELDRAKVHTLRTKFKALDDTTIYILSKLAAENTCLACGSQSATLGKQVTDRLAEDRCPVCGSVHASPAGEQVASLSVKQIEQLQRRIQIESTIRRCRHRCN